MTALSAHNPKLVRLRRLLESRRTRAQEQAYVIEGPLLIGEAIDAGVELEAVFCGEGFDHDIVQRVPAAVPRLTVAAGVLERLGSTVTARPVVAVARWRPGEIPAGATFVLAGAAIADPGNAGTIVRAAEAAGADAVVLTAGSVDPRSPKVVRSSAGALFHVPVVEAGLEVAGSEGRRLVAAVARGGAAPDELDLTGPVALVLGNESHGLAPGDLAAVDELVTIPHVGRAESLNVAMAAAVLAFEVARQRRRRPSGELAR